MRTGKNPARKEKADAERPDPQEKSLPTGKRSLNVFYAD
jgi:hypothetical protein